MITPANTLKCLSFMLISAACMTSVPAQEVPAVDSATTERVITTTGPIDEPPVLEVIDDNIEGFNRGSFNFTDNVLYYVVRPVAKGYGAVVREPVRKSITKFGDNLAFPLRLVNNIIQAKPVAAGEETGRFLLNTTIGLLGFFDPADRIGLKARPEDFGQSFGYYGTGNGGYFFVPLVGPSTVRDGLCLIPDAALKISTYIPGVGVILFLNNFSGRINEYEILRESDEDPYYLLRELYAVGRERDVIDYEIPPEAYEHDPAPTLEALLLKVNTEKFKKKPEEEIVVIESTGGRMPYSYWLQPEAAPVVYILPGIGGHRNSEMARAIAELLYEEGYSIVSISGPFNYEFIDQAGSAAVPGFTPVDADDVYNVLEAVDRDLQERHGEAIRGRSLVGLSLGGLHTLFLAGNEDRRPNGLKFDRYVAINPPVDPIHAVDQLDAYYLAPGKWPAEERERHIRQTLMKALTVTEKPLDADSKLPFDKTESQFLIGLSYRSVLRSAIYESQVQYDLDILKSNLNDNERETIYREISKYSYRDYMNEFVIPYYRSVRGRMDREELIREAGARKHEAALAKNPKVRVITNGNDFILSKDDKAWLEKTFRDRITIFTTGGHLGNLYQKDVQNEIMSALK